MNESRSEEFPELERPHFGLAKVQAAVTIVVGTLLAVGCVVLAITTDQPKGLVIAAGALVLVVLAVAMTRWMRRVEKDPNARNPQNNPVTRSILRLRRDHPVAYALLSAVMFALAIAAVWYRVTN